MKKRTLRAVGAVTAAVMLSQVCTFGASDNFKDVTAKYDWAAEAIDSLYADGVVSGFEDGYFRPASNIRRCDFVVMLYKKFGSEGAYSTALPEDVEQGVYYDGAYMWAASENIVKPGELFYPTEDITRQDAFEMLFKCLERNGTIEEGDISSDLSAFLDGAQVDPDKIAAVGTLVSMGIVNGSDGMILPANTMTRAEMAVVFYMAALEEEEAVDGGIIVDGSTSVNVESADSKYNITTSIDANYLADGIEAALSGEKITVTDGGKSGIIIQNGANLSLENTEIAKSGDSTSSVNTGSSGVNSAIVLRNGSTLDIIQSVINSSGLYANGINVQDGGNTLTIEDCGIVTNTENSTPLLISDDSSVKASDSTFSVKGEGSPAVNITGEGGTAEFDNCIFNAYGSGSPALRSAASKLVLTGGELTSKSDVALESVGTTDVYIEGVSLSGPAALMRITSTAKAASDHTVKNTTTIKNTELVSQNGEALIEVVNTHADIYITGCVLKSSNLLFNSKIDTKSNYFAKGADAVITLDGQYAEGDVASVGSASVTLVLKNGSSLKGALNTNQAGNVNIELLSANDTIELTADCYVGYIENHGDLSFSNIIDKGKCIYYDANLPENLWLDKETYILQNGGNLIPYND